MARDLLDRFFRDAEGKTNRQIDVYFALEDMGVPRERADEGLEFLTSRGLVNMFGPDYAFLTELGVAAVTEDQDLSKLPKAVREFGQSAPPPARAPAQLEEAAKVLADHAPPPAARPPHSDRPQLTFEDADGHRHVVELGATCSIGRVEGNTIHLNDQRASKRHAELRWENGQYIIQDLGAANGTLVNGTYIDRHVLVHGDNILIGRTTLVYTCPVVLTAPRPARAEPAGPAVPGPAVVTPNVIVPPITVEQPRKVDPHASVSPSVQGIKVVKGKPEEAARPAPRAARAPEPVQDLFDTARPSPASELPGPRIPPFPRRPAAEEAGDLFAQPPRARDAAPSDLFDAGAARAPKERDLFARDERAQRGDDLFADHAPAHAPTQAPAPSGPSDLFDAPSPAKSGSTSLFDDARPPAYPERGAIDELAIDESEPVDGLSDPLDPLAEPLRPETGPNGLADDDAGFEATMIRMTPAPAAAELEPEPSDADLGPDTIVPGSLPPEAFEREPFDAEPFDAEPFDAEPFDAGPAAAEPEPSEPYAAEALEPETLDPAEVSPWSERTPADESEGLERTSDVAAGPSEELPEISGDLVVTDEGLDDARVDAGADLGDDALGLADTPQATAAASPLEELPRWGDDAPATGSHPRYGSAGERSAAALEGARSAGEDLPEASVSLAGATISTVTAVSDGPFRATLRQLSELVERADLPDRAEVLYALELIERHPYIRAALHRIERP
ncbi:FHA domain-containing protein [Myxococcota bacterium]|nr:FHA domain-containing protein [Myxococcota bacterium]